MFSNLIIAFILLFFEIICQIVVLITEAISNSKYKTSSIELIVDYTEQSLLVIIVSILLLCLSVWLGKNLKFESGQGCLKISLICICLSTASISYRSASWWFFQSPSNTYYSPTYNVTSIIIVIGGALWVPLLFYKGPEYLNSQINNRDEIVSTGGPPPVPRTCRLEYRETVDELPSYYEMTSPPSYESKSFVVEVVTGGSSTLS